MKPYEIKVYLSNQHAAEVCSSAGFTSNSPLYPQVFFLCKSNKKHICLRFSAVDNHEFE